MKSRARIRRSRVPSRAREVFTVADKCTYILRLRPLPQADDPDGIRRLRAALKALLRSFGLRCVAIDRVPEKDGQNDDQFASEP